MYNIFRFILFYRITYDPFCSIEMKITTFDRLGFMFVQRCVVVKEKHFSDNLILRRLSHYTFHVYFCILHRFSVHVRALLFSTIIIPKS